MKTYQILERPVYTVSAISDADPAVITTTAAHGIQTGDNVSISGLTDADTTNVWSRLNGVHVATRVSDTTFSIGVSTDDFTADAWTTAGLPSPTTASVMDLGWDGRFYATSGAFTGTTHRMVTSGGLVTCIWAVECTATPTGTTAEVDIVVEGRPGPGFTWEILDQVTEADTFGVASGKGYIKADLARRPEMRMRLIAASGTNTVTARIIES